MRAGWVLACALVAACAPIGELQASLPQGVDGVTRTTAPVFFSAPPPAVGASPIALASLPPSVWVRPEALPSPTTLLELPGFRMQLQAGDLRMEVGQSDRWGVRVSEGDGPSSEVGLWSSSNEAVAVVDAQGRVQAVGPGQSLITAHWPPQPDRRVGATVVVRPPDPLALIPEVAPSEAPRGFRWVEGQAWDAANEEAVAGAWLWVDGQAAGRCDAKGRFRIALRPGPHELQLHLAPRYPVEGHGWAQKVVVEDLIAPLGLGPLAMKRLDWLPLLTLTPDAASTWQLVGKQELWVGTQGGLLHRSTDGGASWTAIDLGLKTGVAGIVVDGERFRWVLGQDGALLRSRDGAQAWTSLRPAQADGGVALWAEGELKLWVLTRRALLHSEDAGKSWRSLLQGRFDAGSLVARPSAKQLVVLSPDGAQASGDGGEAWVKAPDALAPGFWDAEASALVASDRSAGRFLLWDAGEVAFKRLGYEGPLAEAPWWDGSQWRGAPGAQAGKLLLGLPRFSGPKRGWRLRPDALEGY